MTPRELSDMIDVRLNAYAQQAFFGNATPVPSIEVDEYEKSVALTKAQKDLIIDIYTGKTLPSFEEKERSREALDSLVKTYTTSEVLVGADHFEDDKHIFTSFAIPSKLLWIIVENAQYAENACVCASERHVDVIPVQHDELLRILKNPFRGPRLHRVLRLNSADNTVELVSDYPIGSYMLRYIEEPNPIILVELPDGLSIDGKTAVQSGSLPDFLHEEIVERAVTLILQSKSIITNRQGNNKTT